MKRGKLKNRIDENRSHGGDFLNLKEVGSAVIHLHANADVGEDSEIEERFVYRIPCEPPSDDGKRKKRRQPGYKRVFYAASDDPNPMQDFLDALEADDSIEDSDVVLSADGVDYTRGDILGKGDWRADLTPSTEFLWSVVASSLADGDRIADPKVQILASRPSLAEAIDKVIDEQVRENGDEEGEASVAGYGIKIGYDADAPASSMYSATYNGRSAEGKVRELLDGPGIELARFCGPPDARDMSSLIAAALVVSVEGFDAEPEAERETRGGSGRKAGGGSKRKSVTERARRGKRKTDDEAEAKTAAESEAKAAAEKKKKEAAAKRKAAKAAKAKAEAEAKAKAEAEAKAAAESGGDGGEDDDAWIAEMEGLGYDDGQIDRVSDDGLDYILDNVIPADACSIGPESKGGKVTLFASKLPEDHPLYEAPPKPKRRRRKAKTEPEEAKPKRRRAKAKPKADPKTEPEGEEGDGEAVTVKCPGCQEETTVSEDSKTCDHCDYKVIPW